MYKSFNHLLMLSNSRIAVSTGEYFTLRKSLQRVFRRTSKFLLLLKHCHFFYHFLLTLLLMIVFFFPLFTFFFIFIESPLFFFYPTSLFLPFCGKTCKCGAANSKTESMFCKKAAEKKQTEEPWVRPSPVGLKPPARSADHLGAGAGLPRRPRQVSRV